MAVYLRAGIRVTELKKDKKRGGNMTDVVAKKG